MPAFPTITLSSPLAKNKSVVEAQHLLAINRWGVKFYSGAQDGQYGPLNGAAAHRAKFWMGYPLALIDNAFGAKLRSYLLPAEHPLAKPLPTAYKIRRAQRIKAAQNKPPVSKGQKVVNEAKTWIGYKEDPKDSNETVFGKWFGADGQPWCGYFVSNILTNNGIAFKCGYVPTIVNWAHTSQNGCYATNDPQVGDPVCFDWDNNGTYDHVGLFDHWVDRAAGTFATVEGNTSPDAAGSQSNGGEVCAKVRSNKAGYGVVFVRVKGL